MVRREALTDFLRRYALLLFGFFVSATVPSLAHSLDNVITTASAGLGQARYDLLRVKLTKISNKLLKWYDTHQRSLPWRAQKGHVADPYHVWLSEIMLQQTTVAAVKSYFEKFLVAWPTVQTLANAPEEDVLAAWAGLGYYARARNLIKCAKISAHECEGIFPTQECDLKKLPGIGDYTAAAVAAIAFGQKAVVVDSNIERIVARMQKIKTPLPAAKKDIKAATALITPNKRSGDFAQAMMDLGSSICAPKAPKCNDCPLKTDCGAYAACDMENYPVKASKKIRPTRRALAYFIEVNGYILLERRPDKGLLGGMPGLLGNEWIEQDEEKAFNHNMLMPPFKAEWSLVEGISKHTFTHFHLETKVMHAKLEARPKNNHLWIKRQEVLDYGLPTVFKKMVKLVL